MQLIKLPNPKMKPPFYRSVSTVLGIISVLVTGCGEKKQAPSQSSAPVACAEEKSSTKTPPKKTTKTTKGEDEATEEAVPEDEVPLKKTSKISSVSFALQSSTSTAGSTSTNTTSGAVSYDKDIKLFWTKSCVEGCHTSKGTPPALETWAEISVAAKAAVASAQAGRMPIGTASLTQAQKTLLLDWEKGGFLQGTPVAGTGTSTSTSTSASNKTSTGASTGTGVGSSKAPVEEPEEEVAEDEDTEGETPNTVKKAKTSANSANNCVKKANTGSNIKKKVSSTTKAKKTVEEE